VNKKQYNAIDIACDALQHCIENNIDAKKSRQAMDVLSEMKIKYRDKPFKKSISKFDYSSFNGGFDDFAVSRQKYSIDLALQLFERESVLEEGAVIGITDAYVRHRAGITEDGDPCVGWWLEYTESRRACPVYALHKVRKGNRVWAEYVYFKRVGGEFKEVAPPTGGARW
jgi:hypothetical protein